MARHEVTKSVFFSGLLTWIHVGRTSAVAACSVCLGLSVVGWGQGTVIQETPQQAVQVQERSPAWNAITSELESGEKTLVNAPAYEVRVSSQWKYRGASFENQGEHHLLLQSVGREQLQFIVRDKIDAEPQYVMDYRKPQLVRWAAAENKYSRVEAEDPRVELQSCGLTQTILELCAVEFLLMSHAREAIQAQLVQVSDLGTAGGLHHFDVRLNNGHQVQVWFQDSSGLPLKIQSSYRKASGDQQWDEVTVTSTLTWQVGRVSAPLQFNVPRDAQQVADLSETMHGRGVEEMLGNPLPKLVIADLEGKPLDAVVAGKVNLLYFWATWAAPSLEGIPTVVEFRDKLQSAGVQVTPINVAESAERARQFLELNKVTGVMGHDATGAAVVELRITHLPAVVIVKPDGTIHQILQDVNQDMRQRIAAEIEKLQGGR